MDGRQAESRMRRFRPGAVPPDFHQGPEQDEAMARLDYLVERGHGLGLLIGPPGSGKSLVLETFAAEARRRGRAVGLVSLLGLEPAEVLCELGAWWDLNLDPAAPPAVLWRAVTDRWAEYRYQQLDAAILLDDADRASAAVATQVARLVRQAAAAGARLAFVAVVRTDRLGRLSPELIELADLRIELGPWDFSQTEEYLRRAASCVGRGAVQFDDEAAERLHALSAGIPRWISRLAELSLLAAEDRRVARIDSALVESVCRELMPAGAPAPLDFAAS